MADLTRMMAAYLDQAADALDGYEFLTMAEAGEVGHWHIEEARETSLELAASEDPNETS